MFSIHPYKAPGPDGFFTSFFQSNCDTVGPTMIREIQNFFIHGSLPQAINSTHIRLIPKISSPKLVFDYMPIALCNVYYKVISKLLSLCLKHLLQCTISKNQSALYQAVRSQIMYSLHMRSSTISRPQRPRKDAPWQLNLI